MTEEALMPPLAVVAVALAIAAIACIFIGGFAALSLGSLLAGIAAALGMPHPHRRHHHRR
jgi:hypothetical protein